MFLSKSKSLLIGFLLFFCTLNQLFANPVFPKLDTDEKKVQFLLYVRKQVPALFEEAARFHISLLPMLDAQVKLREILEENPEYLKLLEQRPAFLDATIQPRSEVSTKRLQIKPEAIESWKSNLIETLDKIPKKMSSIQVAIEQEIIKSSEIAFGKNLKARWKGLLTGIIQEIEDPTLKLEVFKIQDLNLKLEILEKKLPPQLSQKFDSHAYELQPECTFFEAVERLKFLKSHEERLQKLTELKLVVQNEFDSLHAISTYLKNLNENDVSFFADKDALSPRMTFLESLISKHTSKFPAKEMLAQMREHVLSISNQTEFVVEEVKKGIRLREMPAEISIYRGLTGGDCSSQYSFPYPNDPNERIYFMYGEDGKLKGYVQATIVDSQGKRSLYVITVSGSHISATDTRLAIWGLSKLKKFIGVEQIVLPVSSNLSGLINFTPITGVFKELIEGKNAQPIQYFNPALRREIEQFKLVYNGASYDHMDRNNNGVLISEDPSSVLDLKVTTAVAEEFAFEPKPLEMQELFKFALDLKYLNQAEDLNKIFSLGVLSREFFQKSINIIKNSKKLSVQDYQSELRQLLEDLKIEQNMLTQKYYLIQEGLYVASDAMSGENRDAMTKLLIDDLKKLDQFKNTSGFRIEFVRTHIKELSAQKSLQDFILSSVQSFELAGKINYLIRELRSTELVSDATVEKLQNFLKDEATFERAVTILRALDRKPGVIESLIDVLKSENPKFRKLIAQPIMDALDKRHDILPLIEILKQPNDGAFYAAEILRTFFCKFYYPFKDEGRKVPKELGIPLLKAIFASDPKYRAYHLMQGMQADPDIEKLMLEILNISTGDKQVLTVIQSMADMKVKSLAAQKALIENMPFIATSEKNWELTAKILAVVDKARWKKQSNLLTLIKAAVEEYMRPGVSSCQKHIPIADFLKSEYPNDIVGDYDGVVDLKQLQVFKHKINPSKSCQENLLSMKMQAHHLKIKK